MRPAWVFVVVRESKQLKKSQKEPRKTPTITTNLFAAEVQDLWDIHLWAEGQVWWYTLYTHLHHLCEKSPVVWCCSHFEVWILPPKLAATNFQAKSLTNGEQKWRLGNLNLAFYPPGTNFDIVIENCEPFEHFLEGKWWIYGTKLQEWVIISIHFMDWARVLLKSPSHWPSTKKSNPSQDEIFRI